MAIGNSVAVLRIHSAAPGNSLPPWLRSSLRCLCFSWINVNKSFLNQPIQHLFYIIVVFVPILPCMDSIIQQFSHWMNFWVFEMSPNMSFIARWMEWAISDWANDHFIFISLELWVVVISTVTSVKMSWERWHWIMLTLTESTLNSWAGWASYHRLSCHSHLLVSANSILPEYLCAIQPWIIESKVFVICYCLCSSRPLTDLRQFFWKSSIVFGKCDQKT